MLTRDACVEDLLVQEEHFDVWCIKIVVANYVGIGYNAPQYCGEFRPVDS